jgi:hypothetical protein
MADSDNEPPFQGGSQPVKEHPPEVPGPGRTIGQTLVVVLSVLVLLSGLAWFFLYVR